MQHTKRKKNLASKNKKEERFLAFEKSLLKIKMNESVRGNNEKNKIK